MEARTVLLLCYVVAGLTLSLAAQVVARSFTGGEDDEPSDFEVWSAITTSLARWQEVTRHRPWVKHPSYKKLRWKRASQSSKSAVVCYDSVGCFRDEGHFTYLNALPDHPKNVGTHFYLYTRRRKLGELLQPESPSSAFNASNPVKMVIHGFGSSGKRSWVGRMVEALLYAGDVNVVVVDWEKGATLPNYVQAAANTRLVGKQVAVMMRRLMALGARPKDFHLVGFSLGAHVAGFAGSEVQNISRITGLDPAAPLFEGYEAAVRLDPSDAQLVDVIHSNGDSFLKGGLGAYEPLGHIDYYPNGGRYQLGCNNVFIGAITDIFLGNWHSLCHHRRALKFFTESASPRCPFPAFSCEDYESFLRGDCFPCEDPADCSYMGYYSDRSKARGKMFLMTRQTEPFCANQYKIIVNSSAGLDSTWGKIEVTMYTDTGDNETFAVTQDAEEVKGGEGAKTLVAAHPAIVNVTKIVAKYTKYRGWFYGGKDTWFVDKISILDSFGYTVSYCGFRTPLPDGKPVKLKAVPEDCHVRPLQQRVARLVWKVVAGPVLSPRPRPPRLVWTLRLDDETAT